MSEKIANLDFDYTDSPRSITVKITGEPGFIEKVQTVLHAVIRARTLSEDDEFVKKLDIVHKVLGL